MKNYSYYMKVLRKNPEALRRYESHQKSEQFSMELLRKLRAANRNLMNYAREEKQCQNANFAKSKRIISESRTG